MTSITLRHILYAFTGLGLQSLVKDPEIPPEIAELAEAYCMPSGQACLLSEAKAHGLSLAFLDQDWFVVSRIRPSTRGRHQRGWRLFGHGLVGDRNALDALEGDPARLLLAEPGIFFDSDEPYLHLASSTIEPLEINLSDFPAIDPGEAFRRSLEQELGAERAIDLIALVLSARRVALVTPSDESAMPESWPLNLFRILPRSLRIGMGFTNALLMQGHRALHIAAAPHLSLTEAFCAASDAVVLRAEDRSPPVREEATQLARRIVDCTLRGKHNALNGLSGLTRERLNTPGQIALHLGAIDQDLELEEVVRLKDRGEQASRLAELATKKLQIIPELAVWPEEGQQLARPLLEACDRFFQSVEDFGPDPVAERRLLVDYAHLVGRYRESNVETFRQRLAPRIEALMQQADGHSALLDLYRLGRAHPQLARDAGQRFGRWLNDNEKMSLIAGDDKRLMEALKGLLEWFFVASDGAQQNLQPILTLLLDQQSAVRDQWLYGMIDASRQLPPEAAQNRLLELFEGLTDLAKSPCLEAVDRIFEVLPEINESHSEGCWQRLRRAAALWIAAGGRANIAIANWRPIMQRVGLGQHLLRLLWEASAEVRGKAWRKASAERIMALFDPEQGQKFTKEFAVEFYRTLKEGPEPFEFNIVSLGLLPYLSDVSAKKQRRDWSRALLKAGAEPKPVLEIMLKSDLKDINFGGWLNTTISKVNNRSELIYAVSASIDQSEVTQTFSNTAADIFLNHCKQHLDREEVKPPLRLLFSIASIERITDTVAWLIEKTADSMGDPELDKWLSLLQAHNPEALQRLLTKVLKTKRAAILVTRWILANCMDQGLARFGWSPEQGEKAVETLAPWVETSEHLMLLVELAYRDKGAELARLTFAAIKPHLKKPHFAAVFPDLVNRVQECAGKNETRPSGWLLDHVFRALIQIAKDDRNRFCRQWLATWGQQEMILLFQDYNLPGGTARCRQWVQAMLANLKIKPKKLGQHLLWTADALQLGTPTQLHIHKIFDEIGHSIGPTASTPTRTSTANPRSSEEECNDLIASIDELIEKHFDAHVLESRLNVLLRRLDDLPDHNIDARIPDRLVRVTFDQPAIKSDFKIPPEGDWRKWTNKAALLALAVEFTYKIINTDNKRRLEFKRSAAKIGAWSYKDSNLAQWVLKTKFNNPGSNSLSPWTTLHAIYTSNGPHILKSTVLGVAAQFEIGRGNVSADLCRKICDLTAHIGDKGSDPELNTPDLRNATILLNGFANACIRSKLYDPLQELIERTHKLPPISQKETDTKAYEALKYKLLSTSTIDSSKLEWGTVLGAVCWASLSAQLEQNTSNHVHSGAHGSKTSPAEQLRIYLARAKTQWHTALQPLAEDLLNALPR